MTPKHSAKERGHRLKKLRTKAGLARKIFEEKYDISAATLRSWEEGRHTGLTEQGAKRLVLVFRDLGVNVNVSWLLTGEGEEPRISIQFSDQQHKKHEAGSSTSIPEPLSDIQLIAEAHPDPIYTEIIDDSMHPLYEPGTIVLGNRKFGDEIDEAVNQACIIELSSGEILVRHLKQGERFHQYHLVSFNPLTKADKAILLNVEVVSAAPVILSRRKNRN